MIVELPKQPLVVDIGRTARRKIKQRARYLADKFGSVDNTSLRFALLKEVSHLPDELYQALVKFKEAYGYYDYGAIILKGFWDVDQAVIGPTPPRWEEAEKTSEIILMEFAFAVVHAAVGSNMMQYKCQRNGGGLCHQVIADLAKAKSQTGAGSKVDLSIHNEDAGLKTRAEFISLCWLRNFERVPSYLYSARSTDWSEHEYWQKILRKPIFTFYPDGNYSYKPEISQFLHTNKMPILSGNDINPWITTDNIEMIGKQDNEEAESALRWLEQEIQTKVYKGFIPEPGDLVLINNKMCGHGRGKFKAGIDPEKKRVERRWMLRMLGHGSPISIYELGHTENIFYSEEILAGYKYQELEKYIERV